MNKYKLAVCGGTFDLLHLGHRKFLDSILSKSDKLLLGLTSDNYTEKFKAEVFENYQTREKNLKDHMVSAKLLDRVEIVPIDDIYGPLLDKELDADVLFVTEETKMGADQINQKRKNLSLTEIEIVILGMKEAEDGEFISSTRIRKGEIDRQGKLFVNPGWKDKNLLLPRTLREELAKPFGRLLKFEPNHIDPDKVITIGDVTTELFNKGSLNQKLSIIDFVVKRERKFDRLDELGFDQRIRAKTLENPAGKITWNLFESIKNALLDSGRSVIVLNGEEDLAVLPAILIAPLGFTIYYGQPNEGLVEVEISEEKKKEARKLVNKFELS